MQQKVLSKYFAKRLGIVAIVAAAILLVFLLARVQMSVSAVEKISALVPLFESSQDAEELLREASSDVFEIQAARRGFVLTGDEQFAKAFDASAGQLKVIFRSWKRPWDSATAPKAIPLCNWPGC